MPDDCTRRDTVSALATSATSRRAFLPSRASRCHIVPRGEWAHGVGGLVTALVVTK